MENEKLFTKLKLVFYFWQETSMSSTPKKTPVGYLCTVTGKDHLGQVRIRFYGKTKFKEGVWAGLELNTPGKCKGYKIRKY